MGVLDERVAIVTGAAGGIGSGAARRLAEEGAKLVLTDIAEDRLTQLAQELAAGGADVLPVVCDLAEADQIAEVVRATVERHGRVDALANIGQGGMDRHAHLEATTREDAVNAFVTGPLQSLLFMQACLPHMRERGYGRIVNTGSHSALLGMPGFTAYEMAKGAVQALTRNAAKEWGPFGITTNTILPAIWTPAYDLSEQGRAAGREAAARNPMGRLGTPYEDASPVIAFLLSEGAGYLNGQSIGIDGGVELFA